MKLYCAIALFAFAVMGEPAVADQRDNAYAAVERWADAFNSGDVEKVVGVYTTDALVLGTASPGLASTPDDLRAYFRQAAAAKFQVKLGDHSAIALSNDAAVIVGFYDFSRPGADGQMTVIPARFSFVLEKKGDLWQIAHHHSSLKPKPPQ
ncbi:MAG: SgcJ/EcaC family oxidoreductase [Xanthobacteraceae bacterium]|nr:SgcJ/EcaC family oxidoreductase [Xanthobacteraceae bacterium]